MNDIITPLSLLITALAGWLNERHDKTIDFLCEEIETYRKIVGTGRLPLTNDQRRRLAVKGKSVGRKRLFELPRWCSPTPYFVGIASWWLASTTSLLVGTEAALSLGRPFAI